MDSDRRGRQPAIPQKLNAYLTFDQEMGLRTAERFGWDLFFIRRPAFQQSLVVLKGPMGQLAALNEVGELDSSNQIVLRG